MHVADLGQGKEIVMYEADDMSRCPNCKALAVVPLTPRQLKKQPDDTTMVCHPILGGCNHGFAVVFPELN